MNYIVFDLEWNIVGKKNKVSQAEQEKLPFEIIEIGAVKLDSEMQLVSSFSAFVQPKLYPVISHYVARVTKRDQESLKLGRPFPEVARDFHAFSQNGKPVFCSWSKSDPQVIIDNLNYYDIDLINPLYCLDVQTLFAVVGEKASSTTQRSIEYALEYLNVKQDKPLHTALNDAYYTARILQAIWLELGDHSISQSETIKEYLYQPSIKKRR